ncbi:peptidyl-prolyl cis-trans isomerase [Candidatus Sumerlaeota bacterium]|nr:peptidyl-prolyl cis-trans isomerase [Candidatus Sumerlaeota bacterium]
MNLKNWTWTAIIALIGSGALHCARNGATEPPPAHPQSSAAEQMFAADKATESPGITNPESRQTNTTPDEAPAGPITSQTFQFEDLNLNAGMYEWLWKAYQADAAANGRTETDPAALHGDFERSLALEYLLAQYARRQKLNEDPWFRAEMWRQENQLLRVLVERRIRENVHVSAAEIRAYYQANPDKYTDPERVQVRLILVDTEQEARAALQDLTGGDDFAELARRYSKHPSRDKGGVLPPFTRGTYSDAMESAVFAGKVGDLIGPLQTELGYQILEITSLQEKRVIPFSDVESAIREELLQRKYNEQYQELLRQLKAGSEFN